LTHFFDKVVISKEMQVSVAPIPITPCHPYNCQNVPARKVPREPPTK
jgi:hypothetical protein